MNHIRHYLYSASMGNGTINVDGEIRESVDSLCRDGADAIGAKIKFTFPFSFYGRSTVRNGPFRFYGIFRSC